MQFHPERVQTVVIGAGQAGLSVGYHLSRRGLPFVILDANDRIGDSWRHRWDSLRLFTPARHDGLDGLPFPAPAHIFPTKNEMADYLESYAARFDLPVRTGTRVESLTRQEDTYVVDTGHSRLEAEHVVVAMAGYQVPRVPAFTGQLDADIVQFHSKSYRNPTQFKDGPMLIAGVGNSGAEIALEAARGHRTYLAGKETGHMPFDIEGLASRLFLQRFMLRVVFHRLLTVDTPLGRKAQTKVLSQGAPLIRTKPSDLARAGVERVPRVKGVQGGLPQLADGRVLDVTNVIWCTGFTPGFSWIRLPGFDPDQRPKMDKGMALEEPGLYFVGLPFTYAFSSAMIHGVGRDAERIARTIETRARTSVRAPVKTAPALSQRLPAPSTQT